MQPIGVFEEAVAVSNSISAPPFPPKTLLDRKTASAYGSLC
jgi:hypothetical protein